MWPELPDQGEEREERQVGARSRRVSQTMVRGLDSFLLNGRPLERFKPRHDLKPHKYAFERCCRDRPSLDHRMSNS